MRSVAVLLACGLSFAAPGCARKNVHAAAPGAAPVAADAAARPMTTAPDTDATPPVETATAPPALPESPTPAQVALPSAKPPVPRKPAPGQASVDAASEPAHPAAPLISPQLSPGDQAAYQRKTGEDIYVAKKNLQDVSGRQFSAAQQDLVEKINSFLAQSDRASKDGDWARARNLAEKARLLSAELIASF
jgi:hypothetical protein